MIFISMPRIQMENLTGNFLRRMMMGPKCYFIRVSSLVHKWGSHPLNSIFYFSFCYYQLHCCIMQKSCLLHLRTNRRRFNIMLSLVICGYHLLRSTFSWRSCYGTQLWRERCSETKWKHNPQSTRYDRGRGESLDVLTRDQTQPWWQMIPTLTLFIRQFFFLDQICDQSDWREAGFALTYVTV